MPLYASAKEKTPNLLNLFATNNCLDKASAVQCSRKPLWALCPFLWLKLLAEGYGSLGKDELGLTSPKFKDSFVVPSRESHCVKPNQPDRFMREISAEDSRVVIFRRLFKFYFPQSKKDKFFKINFNHLFQQYNCFGFSHTLQNNFRIAQTII